MKRFCIQCGAELENEKFCPNCGAEVEKDNSEHKNIPSITINSDTAVNMIKSVISAAFPVLYIILNLCNWFKISIPYIGTSEYHIYELYGGFSKLYEYVDENTLKTLSILFAVVMLIFSAAVIIFSIRACIEGFKNSGTAMKAVSSVSIIAVVEAVLAIVVVLITKAWVKYAFNELGMGDFGSLLGTSASNLFDFTAVPVVMLVFGVIGSVYAFKFGDLKRIREEESDRALERFAQYKYNEQHANAENNKNQIKPDNEKIQREHLYDVAFTVDDELKRHYLNMPTKDLIKEYKSGEYVPSVHKLIESILNSRNVDINSLGNESETPTPRISYNDILEAYSEKSDDDLRRIAENNPQGLYGKAASELLETREAMNADWICSNCGHENQKAYNFCANCGYRK